MTDAEMLQALIHIKRHIVSKPIKLYIDSVIRRIKLAQLRHKFTAGMYKVEFEAPLYDQKKCPSVDVVA